ncbi:MAG: hypothetical protein ABIJ16_10200, partial [Bacteroidota bacterium]
HNENFKTVMALIRTIRLRYLKIVLAITGLFISTWLISCKTNKINTHDDNEEIPIHNYETKYGVPPGDR